MNKCMTCMSGSWFKLGHFKGALEFQRSVFSQPILSQFITSIFYCVCHIYTLIFSMKFFVDMFVIFHYMSHIQ